jgi:hypothetical protein
LRIDPDVIGVTSRREEVTPRIHYIASASLHNIDHLAIALDMLTQGILLPDVQIKQASQQDRKCKGHS